MTPSPLRPTGLGVADPNHAIGSDRKLRLRHVLYLINFLIQKMPKCTRLKDAKEHTHFKMPMSTMLKDANEHTSRDTCETCFWGVKELKKVKFSEFKSDLRQQLVAQPRFAPPSARANLTLRHLRVAQTSPVFSVSLILQILSCLVFNIYMTKLIQIIKVMRGRSQGEVKETKSSKRLSDDQDSLKDSILSAIVIRV
ncbi:hypothetical protein L6452_02175 [Arctium lappa]|uniref:Uncharacterized protein n=1 Tax=Arctium lappa TaxID=4217 RepID=A0ACB9FI45_ARCLA|nr:hypothetical protein L6452_02175 [Arctium lappa]